MSFVKSPNVSGQWSLPVPMQMVCVACLNASQMILCTTDLACRLPRHRHVVNPTLQPFSRLTIYLPRKRNNTFSMFPVFLVSAFLTFIIVSSCLRRITRSSPEEHPVKNTGAPQKRTKQPKMQVSGEPELKIPHTTEETIRQRLRQKA